MPRFGLFKLRRLDWFLLFVVLVLAAFGLTSLYSIALAQEEPNFFYFNKQIISFLIGFVLLVVFSLIDYRLWGRCNLILYVLSIVLLLTVLFLGTTIRGTTGWFYVAGWSFQPVEMVKIFFVVFLASFFVSRLREIEQFRTIILSFLWLAVILLLIIAQPDLGSGLIFAVLWLGFLLMMKIKVSHFILIIVIFSLLAGSGYFFLKDYQKARINTFLDPAADPYGRGYNVLQSIIAVGAGRWWGKGLSLGSQSQLKFLPESQNDFIFAVIAEELGLLGCGLVLFFWGLLIWRCLAIAKRCRDDFGKILILGLTCLLFLEVFVNIGMNIGLLPVVGISLPLISGGGSGLIASLIMIGILENISMQWKN